MFGILRIPPFVNHKGNDVNSDWLADQWDERSVLGRAQFHKGRMKGDDPEIYTAQTPKSFDRRLALLGKTRETFTDSIPNNDGMFVGFCESQAHGNERGVSHKHGFTHSKNCSRIFQNKSISTDF